MKETNRWSGSTDSMFRSSSRCRSFRSSLIVRDAFRSLKESIRNRITAWQGLSERTVSRACRSCTIAGATLIHPYSAPAGSANPHDGVALEYVNPVTGGSTLPTISCRIQMLRPGERTQSHRHTSTSIYHAFRGSGTTIINGEPFHWEKGDSFVVPLWHWHEHANASSGEEAILFSMHDEPVMRAFGLYREERQRKIVAITSACNLACAKSEQR